MARPDGTSGRIRHVTRSTPARSFETPEGLASAWAEYKATGSDGARNRLVEHYLYLVRFAAERVGAKLPEEVDVDDLMSAGVFGLVDAIDAFDVTRGVKFETYCAPRIRGAILDELRTMDWVPRLVRHRSHKLERVTRMLEVELGRLPTEEEISARLDVGAEQFQRVIRDANAVSLVSLSRKHYDSDAQRDVLELDLLQDSREPDPMSRVQKEDLKDLITRGLSRAERLIVVLYYYEQMTMKEIGATLDLSESRVSQMHSATLLRLKAHLEARRKEFATENV